MSNTTDNKTEQGLNLTDLLVYMLSKWQWFLLSVLICGGLAWLYYARAPLVYFRSATVIIKDPSNKTSTAGLDRYDNYINRVNVTNEILQFRSKRLIREVVQRLRLNISYQVKDGLRYNELYTQSPVSLDFIEVLPNQYLSMTVIPKDENSVMLGTMDPELKEEKYRLVQLRDTFMINPNTGVCVNPTNFYSPAWKGVPVYVHKQPVEVAMGHYRGSVSIRQEEEDASILTLALKDNSPVRAEDVLNTLITVYNEEALKDKNQVAVNTADFINERLIIIENELGSVESDLESFKRDNQIVDISSAAGMYMSESQKYNTDALELETQLKLADFIKHYLTDPSKETDLIPANTGLSDMNIENQINLYNSTKLKRDRLMDDSSEKNPVVEELNNSLRAMKQTIIRAVDNLIVSLRMKRQDAKSREVRAQTRVQSIPTKERNLLSIERQQKIKESLYLFLLNRREENALSQAMADSNARIIDSAEGGNVAIAPQPRRILLMGVLIGVAIPALIFLLKLFMDTKVYTRKEVERALSVPLLGEIPLDKKLLKRKRRKQRESSLIKDTEGMVPEAFRIVRTNMNFMARKDRPMQVITLTSFNEGVGKTFIAQNLALSLARTKKRVILVDLDIRKGILSRHFGSHRMGVTNYLADPEVTLEQIVRHHDDFDLIPSGTVAPNPAELLMDSRLDGLFAQLRESYDYILADSVPLGIIADATITNRLADLTLFVIRAGKLDRRQMPDIEKLYEEKKLNNMAMVLNGVDPHRRGYGYGYGYGYRYEYK